MGLKNSTETKEPSYGGISLIVTVGPKQVRTRTIFEYNEKSGSFAKWLTDVLHTTFTNHKNRPGESILVSVAVSQDVESIVRRETLLSITNNFFGYYASESTVMVIFSCSSLDTVFTKQTCQLFYECFSQVVSERKLNISTYIVENAENYGLMN